MKITTSLEELVVLQKLSLSKCERNVRTKQTVTKRLSSQLHRLAEVHDLANHQLSELMQSDRFCLDRMILAMGHLATSQRALSIGQTELNEASSNEEDARLDWQEAQFRLNHLSKRVRLAVRVEERKRDNKDAAEALFLRVVQNGEFEG